MPIDFNLYVALVYFLTALPYAWMGLYAWRTRPAVAVTPFAWMALCMSVWSAAYGLEILLPDISFKTTATLVQYFGSAAIPILLVFFALEFTGRKNLLAPRARAAFLALLALAWLLAWTNHHHYLVWTGTRVFEYNGMLLLGIRYGPLYWIFFFFSLSLTLGAVFLLIAETLQRPGSDRIQINLIVMGIVAPVASRILYVAGMELIAYLDLTPLLALPAALGLAWAITRRYRLRELFPPEYLTLLKDMQDGVVIVDALQRVIYLNPVAQALFGRSEADAIGQPLRYVSAVYGGKIAPYLGGEECRAELVFEAEGQSRAFELTVSPLSISNAPQAVFGSNWMIVLHDILRLKENELTLSRRESLMSALRMAAEQFLKGTAWEHNIPGVLEKIGQAADLSRVFVAMNYADKNGTVFSSLCYEWAGAGIPPQLGNPLLKHVPLQQAGLSRWEKLLAQGNPVCGLVEAFPESEKVFLRQIGSLSIAIMPIFVNKQWWGFIVFDECRRQRVWSETELETLSIAASMFGSAEARARAEFKLIRRQKSLDILHELVIASLKAEDLLSMAQALVEKFAALIHANQCALSLWDDANKQEIQLAEYDPHESESRARIVAPADLTFTELVLGNGRVLVVEDANAAIYEASYPIQISSAGAVVALPLMAGAKKLGSVLLSFDQPQRFQSEEIAICEQASNLVALALEKFQIVERAERRALTSETLRKASAAVAETLQPDDAVARILEQLQQVVPCDGASVQLLRENKLEVVGGSGFQNSSSVVGVELEIPGDNPNTLVLQTGKPYLLSDAEQAARNFREFPLQRVYSWLGVPLIFQGRIIGLLAICSAQPNRFTAEDINLAAMFANQVAVTLENARVFKETRDQAITDALTGVYNRRGLFQIGDFEFIRARRMNRPFSILMFDIDHFKKINDTHGHLAGDQILQELAERCRTNSRAIDVVCRYGGEEFIIFLPDTGKDTAQTVAERLRRKVMDTNFHTDAGEIQVTISIGVTQARERDSLKTLIERADHALYAAKRAGRNRVAVSDGATHPLSQT